MEKWNVEEETGYTPKTTFWEDFSIADRFGESAIKETYSNVLNSWADDYVYLTELVMVLNHKIWYWYERNEKVARLYDKLWREVETYATKKLKGGELDYYYRTLD